MTIPNLPADTCLFCDKSIKEIGGKRIVASSIFCIGISDKHISGGSPQFPFKNLRIEGEKFLIIQGGEKMWTDERIVKGKDLLLKGITPWVCQVCLGRTCEKCGKPTSYTGGVDIIYDDGTTGHCACFGISTGCINPLCENHR